MRAIHCLYPQVREGGEGGGGGGGGGGERERERERERDVFMYILVIKFISICTVTCNQTLFMSTVC